MSTIAINSVDCILTDIYSYGKKDFASYISVFQNVYPLLKSEGTCWIIFKSLDKCLSPLFTHKFQIEMLSMGWILRNELIYKTDDLCNSSNFVSNYYKILFYVKNKKYYFNIQYEKIPESTYRRMQRIIDHRETYDPKKHKTDVTGHAQISYKMLIRSAQKVLDSKGKLPRSVRGESENIYEKILLTGCPPNGIVFNPLYNSKTIINESKRLGMIPYKNKEDYY